MSNVHIFTSAAANYLPKVRLLCQSIKKYHPEITVHLALADKRMEWLNVLDEPFDNIIELDQLNIPQKNSWIFFHNIVEFSTAIKPFVLRYLLSRSDCSKVFYFDPDMVLFSRVDDIIAVLDEYNIVLTPHQTRPEQSLEAIIDNEICSMKHGIYNLGFIGVKNSAEGNAFAQWWSERLYHFCIGDTKQGLWTDQKWIDFVPVFFDGVKILKSPRHNVAPWNITTRSLAGNFEDGFTVDGEQLGFYHFTGFDSGAHEIMASKYAPGNNAVGELINWYKLQQQVKSETEKTPWAFQTYDSGTRIKDVHRWIYRNRNDLQAAYPEPFFAATGNQTLLSWLNTRGKIEYPEMFLADSMVTQKVKSIVRRVRKIWRAIVL